MTERPALMMVRRGDQLHPASAFDGENLRAFPAAKALRVAVTTPRRSSPQNRLYWSLLGLVAENLEGDVTPEDLHEWLKVKMGVVRPIPLRSGKVEYVTGSTAFDKMNHDAFTKYFAKVKALIAEHIIPVINSDSLEAEARAMLGEAA